MEAGHRYSIPELAWFAQQAGFTGSALTQITAIAVRESGGDAGAVGDIDNPTKGCRSYGLVQINVCPSPGNKGIPYRENPQSLLDPQTAMKAAYDLSKGGRDFGPWMTYRSGIAAPPIGQVEQELARSGGPKAPADAGGLAGLVSGIPNPIQGVTDTANALENLSNFAGQLADPKTWLRVAMALGGATAMLVGLLIMGNALAGRVVGRVMGGGGKSDDEHQDDGKTEPETDAGAPAEDLIPEGE